MVYRIVDPHNYLLMTIDGKLLRQLFEHERLKPAMIRTDKGNINTLSALKRVMNLEISYLTHFTHPCQEEFNDKMLEQFNE